MSFLYLFLYYCVTVDHIFFPQTTVVDATKALREKLTEIKGLGPETQYGLFLADEDPKKGVWLEPGRTQEHYLLRENVSTNFILFQYWTISVSSILII